MQHGETSAVPPSLLVGIIESEQQSHQQAAGREDSSMNLQRGDMFIVRYRPIRSLVLEGRVDLI